MGFLSLLLVASMPVVQLLIICFVGVILATKNINILSPSARRNLNKIVFTVFGPALIFGSLTKTITLQDLISWWFMPVNIGITFLVGGSLGWVAVKILKPKPHLEGLIIASCSAGNLGYMLLIIIPEVCSDEGSPFGDHKICTDMGLCYNSLSMALGGFYIWTHTYSLMKSAGIKYEQNRIEEGLLKEPSIKVDNEETLPISSVVKTVIQAEENQTVVPLLNGGNITSKPLKIQEKLKETIHLFVEELMTAPTIAAVLGFIVGVVPWLKGLIIGGTAPFRVIEDSITLLG